MSPNTEEEPRKNFSNKDQHFDSEHKYDCQDDKDRFIAHISEIVDRPMISLQFEIELEKVGLLSPLENAGIIPTVENPNPFDPDLDENRHDKWWIKHPEEAEEFSQNIEKRKKSINNIYIGMVLGFLFGNRFFRKQ